MSLGMRVFAVSTLVCASDIDYYSRASCEAKGLLPRWYDAGYIGETYFEKIFKTPLNVDLIAAAHSGQESGFEQVTADWGCDFEATYGTGGNAIGYYGVGAKDPAGGGCPKGPVKVYEDLVCALRLGLESNPTAFSQFCSTDSGEELGVFECLGFFANVITETGAFAETEERDPRPYCWDRNSGDCCPAADHKPCLPDSDRELTESDYPTPHDRWLTDRDVSEKCCSYHGRGFLQVSYEPNYRMLSEGLFGDETILWHYPYKLDSDGVMGWSAALWYWFNEHGAQVASQQDGQLVKASPRAELYRYKEGAGLPGTVNIINGAECSGEMDTMKAKARTSYMFAIAHRLGVSPPTEPNEEKLPYYPLPGTKECQDNTWCRQQFHNPSSVCPVFRAGVNCVSSPPYVQNISTPMGWNRRALKTSRLDGLGGICEFGPSPNAPTPAVMTVPQEPLEVIENWHLMLDIHRENVCGMVRQKHLVDGSYVEGRSELCKEMCWKQFAWDVSVRGESCEQPQMPCKTLAEYVSHPIPQTNWESGEMGSYFGGEYLGRVGPGLVKALNGERGFGDKDDGLCYWFGASPCHWNVAMGCVVQDPATDIHGCRVYPEALTEYQVDSERRDGEVNPAHLAPGQRPGPLTEVLKHFDLSNCPTPTGDSLLEQMFPRGELDMDMLFSAHYSAADGFANSRYDNFDDVRENKENVLYGAQGPKHVWHNLLCAYLKGIPDDPDYFTRNLFRRTPGLHTNFSEDEIRFAKLEFAAMAANMIKETGNLGQAEERDPRCYCNYMGGEKNKCCPNEWGNNPACSQLGDSTNHMITEEQMAHGMSPLAGCCSYHGRGFLQTSYEMNYGDLGATMLASKELGISPELGRRYLLSYPQSIDGFGVSGWAATLAFWLGEHPCEYCDGKNTTTVDWNAHRYSPHEAMVRYNEPGQGLGKTFNIINGLECEAPVISEFAEAPHGSSVRLTLFYNLAARMRLKAPGESHILPLPGTVECDQSEFCRGTFMPDPKSNNYRTHSGGCWALTPQPLDDGSEVWPFCRIPELKTATSKYAAKLQLQTFSIGSGASGDKCTTTFQPMCGSKIISPSMKPSMYTDPELSIYTAEHVISSDYDDPQFIKYMGLTWEDFCKYAYDSVPGGLPSPQRDCQWWCLSDNVKYGCANLNPETCEISASGIRFAKCAEEFWKSNGMETMDCRINFEALDAALSSGTTSAPPAPTVAPTAAPTMAPGGNSSQNGGVVPCDANCEICGSYKGGAVEDAACKKCAFGGSDWPCQERDYCSCKKQGSLRKCDSSCSRCVSIQDEAWADESCKSCNLASNAGMWPCNVTYCKCVS